MHYLRFDSFDDGNEEVYGQPGEIVNEHCRSYLFTVKDEAQRVRKVRLIDTPAFGDVRERDQDEKNMREVVMFMNSMERIHAVCVLMKPNVVRLNETFQTYSVHLVDLFGDIGSSPIALCYVTRTVENPSNDKYSTRYCSFSLSNGEAEMS